MDLKFSFDGASSTKPKGTAPSGAKPGDTLPFTVTPATSSGILEVQVRVRGSGVTAEAVSGDGVTYAHSEIVAADQSPESLSRSVRSAVARVVAELGDQLASSISSVSVELAGADILAIDAMEFQRRTGIAAGTPVHVA